MLIKKKSNAILSSKKKKKRREVNIKNLRTGFVTFDKAMLYMNNDVWLIASHRKQSSISFY